MPALVAKQRAGDALQLQAPREQRERMFSGVGDAESGGYKSRGGRAEGDMSCLWKPSDPSAAEKPLAVPAASRWDSRLSPALAQLCPLVLLLVLPLCCLPGYPQPAHSPSYLLWPA